MRAWAVVLLAFITTTGPARAHFIWVIPAADGGSAEVAWCDTPEPDGVEDKVTYIATAKTLLWRANGRVEDMKWTEGKDLYRVACPGEDARTLVVVLEAANGCHLVAKTYLPGKDGKIAATAKAKGAEPLELEIVPRLDRDAGTFQVLRKGKPLASARVNFHIPGKYRALPRQTSDQEGLFVFKAPEPGVWGLVTTHQAKETGKGDEKHFYSTLVIRAPAPAKK